MFFSSMFFVWKSIKQRENFGIRKLSIIWKRIFENEDILLYKKKIFLYRQADVIWVKNIQLSWITYACTTAYTFLEVF